VNHPLIRIPATLLLLSLVAVPPAMARRAVRAAPASQQPLMAAAPRFAPTPVLSLSEAEERAISRSTAGLVPFRLENGAVGLNLQGGFEDFVVARVGADGKVATHCVNDADALLRLLTAPVTPAPTPVVLEDR
jgi:hypothetical protein